MRPRSGSGDGGNKYPGCCDPPPSHLPGAASLLCPAAAGAQGFWCSPVRTASGIRPRTRPVPRSTSPVCHRQPTHYSPVAILPPIHSCVASTPARQHHRSHQGDHEHCLIGLGGKALSITLCVRR
jgi:hypothetical protein